MLDIRSLTKVLIGYKKETSKPICPRSKKITGGKKAINPGL
jgi:hypothetical protein